MKLVKLDVNGKIVIPSEIRGELAIRKGTVFKIEMSDGRIILKRLPKAPEIARSADYNIVKVDVNGRVRIPSKIRKDFEWKHGDLLEIHAVDENTLEVKKSDVL